MPRSLAVALAQLRASVARSLAYRAELAVELVLAAFRVVVALVPLRIALAEGRRVGGWSFDEALVVLATFTLLSGFLEALVHPSLVATVESIRSGALDLLLLKPADAQLLASTARFLPLRLVDVAVSLTLYGVAFARLGRAPAPHHVGAFALLALSGLSLLYSLAVLVLALAFRVVKLDNLSYLLTSVFDFARWPSTVFRGGARLAFTYVIPLAVMTTTPAEALLGRLTWTSAAVALGLAALFALVSRAAFGSALRGYTSASS